MIRFAFKEWAVICRALAEGRQALIMRKGGIAEDGNVFRPEHPRFWLYPTYVHQQRDGVKPEALPLLEASEREKPPAGIIRLTHFVEVSGAFFVDRLDVALALDKLHLWSLDTVKKRFEYREPGLFALAARAYRIEQPIDVPHNPEFDGCKTWVEFNEGFSTEGATPVIESRRYADFLEEIDAVLNPQAFA
jgi:hypothetical protein